MFLSQQSSIQDNEQVISAICFIFCNSECIQSTLLYQLIIDLFLTVMTIFVSVYNIYMHLTNFNNPFLQSKIIKVILIMAPFYCITSVGSFIFPSLMFYFVLTRDCYEAILLFTFFYLIFSYLAYSRQKDQIHDKKVYLIMISHKKQVHHFFPFYYCQKAYQLSHWKKAKYFTYRCKKYVLQFLVVKVITTLLMYIIYPNQEMYTSEQQHSSSPWFNALTTIIQFIVPISASYSLYYLVLFYHALHKPLRPYSPLLKFLTIKITLFFTFWQKIMLTIFKNQIISCFDHTANNYNPEKVITSLENTLICLQMLVMAFAGGIAYSFENYVVPGTYNKGSFCFIARDTLRTFRSDFRLIRPKKFGFNSEQSVQIEMKQINQHQNNQCTINIRIAINEQFIQHYF